MRPAEAVILAALILSPPAHAADPPRAGRWHFVFGNLLGKDFELSVLFNRTQHGDDTRLLVAASAGRFVFDSRQDPGGKDSTESVRAMTSGETFERRLLFGGYEHVPGCERVKPPDACVVWTGTNGSVVSSLSAFSGEAGKALRGNVAALVPERTKKSLFGLAPILPAVTEFGSYKDDFLALVWPETFNRSQSLRRGKRTAGCDFDATFGYPCDATEKERERRRFDEP